VLAGELSLSGRLRSAARSERRMAEAARLGFERMVTGPERGSSHGAAGRVVAAADLREALRQALVEG
jgi:predicted ATP-dependent serine protease